MYKEKRKAMEDANLRYPLLSQVTNLKKGMWIFKCVISGIQLDYKKNNQKRNQVEINSKDVKLVKTNILSSCSKRHLQSMWIDFLWIQNKIKTGSHIRGFSHLIFCFFFLIKKISNNLDKKKCHMTRRWNSWKRN